MSKKELTVKCPTCKLLVPRSEKNFPFCSERCKTIDLGNWASDTYSIKGGSNFDIDDEDAQSIH
ncbi:MAG: DNA gyrase inhibitor YacG [Ghiorsea sp.]